MARRDKGSDQGGGPPSDEGWGTPIHGTRPIAGTDPYGTGGIPAAQPGPSDRQPGRGRTWLILLVSFVVQLVVVLAGGNTWVVRKALEFRADHVNDLAGAFATSPSVYAWRLTPTATDRFHFYPASLFGLLTFFVVAALLTLALVRGPVTFWRAFVAVTLSVLAGTLAGGMVRRAILTFGNGNGTDKATSVLFQGGGSEIVAGLITGLLAGLIAAIVAVASRRPAEAVVPLAAPVPPPYVEPAPPPPWHGDDVRSPAMVPPSPPREAPREEPPSLRKPQSDDAQATTQFAAAPSPAAPGGGDTTRLRREDAGEYGPPTVVTRETKVPADAPETDDQPERSDHPEQPQEQRAERQPDPSEVTPAEAPEAAEPPVDQRTTEFPAERPRQGSADATQAMPAAPQSAPSTQSTQSTQSTPSSQSRSFPRPPDDEDLGHQPEDD